MRSFLTLFLGAAAFAAPASEIDAQAATTMHKHMAGMHHDSLTAGHETSASMPTMPGQATYGAITEIVRLLEADLMTDWSKVNLEALRQHLIDMDDVTMHALVASTPVDGGLYMRVTGAGRTGEAVRRMLTAHVVLLDASPDYRATASPIDDGMQLTVVARRPGDQATVAKVRGLGFIGLLTYGDHHAPHHMALARGEAVTGHSH